MNSQWKPISSVKLEQPGIFVDRHQEMSVQQKLIEQKKKQIEQKMMEKKHCEAGNSGNPDQAAGSSNVSKYTKRPGFTGKSSLPELMPPKVLASAELFTNDGSFMEKFLKLQQEMKDKKFEDASQRSETAEEVGSQTFEMAKTKPYTSNSQNTLEVPENAAIEETSGVDETTLKQRTFEGSCVPSGLPEISRGLVVANASLALASPTTGQHGSTFVVGGSQAEAPIVTNDHVQPPSSFPPPPPLAAPGTSFPVGFPPSFPYLASPLPPSMSGPAGYCHYPMRYGYLPRPGVPYYQGPVLGRGAFPPPPPPPPPLSSNQSITSGYGSPGFGPGGFPLQWPPFRPQFGGQWQVGPREPPAPHVDQPPSTQVSGAPFMNPGESHTGPRGPSVNVNVVSSPVGPGGEPTTGHSDPQLQQPTVPPLIPNMNPPNVHGPNNMGGQFSGDLGPRLSPTSQFCPRPPLQEEPLREPFDSKTHSSRPELSYQNSDVLQGEDYVDDDDFDGVHEDDDDYGLRHKQKKRQMYGEDYGETSNSNLEFCDSGRSGDGIGNFPMENNNNYGYIDRADSLSSHSFSNSGYNGPGNPSPSYRQSCGSPDRGERQRSRSPFGHRGGSSSYGGLRESPYDDSNAFQGSFSDHHSRLSSDDHWYHQSNVQRLPNDADFRNGKRGGYDPELSAPVHDRYVPDPDTRKRKLTADADADDDDDEEGGTYYRTCSRMSRDDPAVNVATTEIIDRFVDYVARNGQNLEELALKNNCNHPEFRFLFDEGSPANQYYHERMQHLHTNFSKESPVQQRRNSSE